MTKKKSVEKSPEIPQPERRPEIEHPDDPGEPTVPAEDPDWMPYENPFETLPYEMPSQGEGI